MTKKIETLLKTEITIIIILLSCIALILITQEHYRVERYTITMIHGHRIYYEGGSIFINKFYYPIENDLNNLSSGDDILIHYMESVLGRTYIRLEKV